MKKISLKFGSALAFLLLSLITLTPASAQTAVPDFTQFGFPRVTATANFTPGQDISVIAGRQSVRLPADFYSKAVKFEFLEGDASSFPNLGDAQGQRVVTVFAFRVTDIATGQLVGRFDKPVTYTATDPLITSASQMYNTSAANPPVVTKNPTASTVQGNNLSQNFGGAGVGWLVLTPNTPGAPASGTGGIFVNNAAALAGIYLSVGLALVASVAGSLLFVLNKQ